MRRCAYKVSRSTFVSLLSQRPEEEAHCRWATGALQTHSGHSSCYVTEVMFRWSTYSSPMAMGQSHQLALGVAPWAGHRVTHPLESTLARNISESQ
jgi:hypothetical protein